MTTTRKPIVFRNKTDGEWRSRMQDEKGKWRTFKFVDGLNEPGVDGGPPPTVESGAFKRIPKAIRETLGTEAPAQPEPAAPTPAPEPAQSQDGGQPEPAEPTQPEPAQSPQAPEKEVFPPLCADAMRVPPPPTQEEAGGTGPTGPKEPGKLDIPVVEMMIDTMFAMGEAMGGPKAPKGSATEGLSMEGLRSTMVRAGNEAFPKANLDAGPKTTFFGCMCIYLVTCYQKEKFRENAAPWYERMREKIGLWWHRMRARRREKRENKKEEKTDA